MQIVVQAVTSQTRVPVAVILGNDWAIVAPLEIDLTEAPF